MTLFNWVNFALLIGETFCTIIFLKFLCIQFNIFRYVSTLHLLLFIFFGYFFIHKLSDENKSIKIIFRTNTIIFYFDMFCEEPLHPRSSNSCTWLSKGRIIFHQCKYDWKNSRSNYLILRWAGKTWGDRFYFYLLVTAFLRIKPVLITYAPSNSWIMSFLEYRWQTIDSEGFLAD